MTFREFVSHYGLARSEGAVLRYLPDALTALRSRVPAAARTDEVTDLVEWLGELVHEVDTSLLDEWEQLTSPDQPLDEPGLDAGPATSADRQRAGVHRDGPQGSVPAGEAVCAEPLVRPRRAGWRSGRAADRLKKVVHASFAEHDKLGTGADALADRRC